MIVFLGFLSASVHGTKELGAELAVNLELFKKAYFQSMHHCSSSSLSPFIEYLTSGQVSFHRQRNSNEDITEQDKLLLYSYFPPETTIKSMKYSRNRFFLFFYLLLIHRY